MFPLSALSDVSSEWFPACFPFACHLITILTLLLISHFSPFSALLLSPLGSRLWALTVFYPFHCNLYLSPIKPNANPIPLPPCFPLAWPLFTLPPALASLQPYTLSLPHMSGPLNTFIISCLLLFCIVSWEPASFLPWSGTIELNMTCCLHLLVVLNT